jgi:hypothetical protein
LRSAGLDVVQVAFILALFISPWAPQIDGHSDRAIAEELSFRRERENIRHEHRRDLFLVDLVDLNAPSNQVTALRVGVFASPITSGSPFTKNTTSKRFSTDPDSYVHWLQTVRRLLAGSAASTKCTDTCSPFVPNGIVLSPRSQAMKFSFARTRPSA